MRNDGQADCLPLFNSKRKQHTFTCQSGEGQLVLGIVPMEVVGAVGSFDRFDRKQIKVPCPRLWLKK